MAAVLLDAGVVIELLRGRPAAVERLRQLQLRGDRPFVCAVTSEEITVGLFPREREAATLFFDGVAEAPLGVAEGRTAGWWRRTYRSRGRTLAQADCLTAAAALALGATLATTNPKDFPMKEVVVEAWPVG